MKLSIFSAMHRSVISRRSGCITSVVQGVVSPEALCSRPRGPQVMSKRGVLTFNKFRQMYQDFWKPPPAKPPYSHICQIGDPVLRGKASPVKPEEINSAKIKKIIKTMASSLKGYKAIGLAAPQVGVPLRIVVFHFPENSLKTFDEKTVKIREMETIPFKVFINPEMKVTSPNKIRFPEACESIKGFSADVPRFYSVKLTGLNENGSKVQWDAKGWSARVIQHEMDHLDGRLYTDIMDKNTFSFGFWHNVNIRSGRFNLSFSPYKIFS